VAFSKKVKKVKKVKKSKAMKEEAEPEPQPAEERAPEPEPKSEAPVPDVVDEWAAPIKKKAVFIGSWADLVEEPRDTEEPKEAAVTVVTEVGVERDPWSFWGATRSPTSRQSLSWLFGLLLPCFVSLVDVWCREDCMSLSFCFELCIIAKVGMWDGHNPYYGGRRIARLLRAIGRLPPSQVSK